MTLVGETLPVFRGGRLPGFCGLIYGTCQYIAGGLGGVGGGGFAVASVDLELGAGLLIGS